MHGSRRFCGPAIQVLLGRFSPRALLKLAQAVHFILPPIVHVDRQNTLSRKRETQLRIRTKPTGQSIQRLRSMRSITITCANSERGAGCTNKSGRSLGGELRSMMPYFLVDGWDIPVQATASPGDGGASKVPLPVSGEGADASACLRLLEGVSGSVLGSCFTTMAFFVRVDRLDSVELDFAEPFSFFAVGRQGW